MTTLLARVAPLAAIVFALALWPACGPSIRNTVPPGTLQPDQFLFDRGTQALDEKRWLVARQYFQELIETYTQSPLRSDGKLGLGDTYLGEGGPEALVLAISEFQEFLAFFPTNARVDYAQYKLGLAYFKQMRAPGRDQTETKSAVTQFDAFVARYPTSSLMPEVQARLREARDRLSENDFMVGRFYYRIQWYPGAIDRFVTLLKEDPTFTDRDGVYFYLGESLLKSNRSAEALPYFERLVAEFLESEHLDEARERLTELKAQAQAKPSSSVKVPVQDPTG